MEKFRRLLNKTFLSQYILFYSASSFLVLNIEKGTTEMNREMGIVR